MPKSKVELRFDQAMVDIYNNAKRELRYNATRFFEMVVSQGGLATARQLLWSDTPSDGFTKLWEYHRLDLTVEAHVLLEEFESLFTDDDRAQALTRLKEYGWRPPNSERSLVLCNPRLEAPRRFQLPETTQTPPLGRSNLRQ